MYNNNPYVITKKGEHKHRAFPSWRQPRLARLRETCYHPCDTDFARVKKVLMICTFRAETLHLCPALAAAQPNSAASHQPALCLSRANLPASAQRTCPAARPRPCEFTDPKHGPPSPPRLAGTAGHHPAAPRAAS